MGIPIFMSAAAAESIARVGEPIRLGVPFAKGAVRNLADCLLLDDRGRPVPMQSRALDRWSDQSVRWGLLDFFATHDGHPPACTYVLDTGAHRPDTSRALATRQAGDRVVVDTGSGRFVIRVGGTFPFEEVTCGGAPAVDPARGGLAIEDADGRRGTAAILALDIEDAGPLRAVVRLEGTVARPGDGSPLMRMVCRCHFFSGSTSVQFDLALHNPRRARHPGGLWDLGDSGSIFFRDVRIAFALPQGGGPATVWHSAEPGRPLTACRGELNLFQASSGGEHWDSHNHVNRAGQVPLAFRGYRLTTQTDAPVEGLRATPVVALRRDDAELAITLPRFWETFPKAIDAGADTSTLALALFPRQHGDLHELQGGERKTHRFFVAFGRDAVTALPLDWARRPLVPRASPAHYAASGAVPYLPGDREDAGSAYDTLLASAVEGSQSFQRKREVIDEYGWRNFGDLYADHEAVFNRESRPLISHYNNQYDAVGGFAIQFMRTGDLRWWTLADDLAAHVSDIDIYHTDQDKAAYNHGLFWHTAHYVDAGRSTHRSYPNAPGVRGGGPSPEHNYTSGLLLHYFLTGDATSRAAALELARWVVDMDDGGRSPFRWLARGDTGLATATNGSQLPGRGAGNSIRTLINAHRLTGAPSFLLKAEALIRRCVHPADDVAARDLMDAEQRWSYTVLLHAVGTYLDDKDERGEHDAMYAYSRQSLLTYARWMAAHERPYLDRPETLEYPTETWAAQELWKCEVFDFAAKYAAPDERARFLERAEFFFDYSMTTLAAMETRTLVRPLVLLASRHMHLFARRHHGRWATRTDPPVEIPRHAAPFVPLKARARRRAIGLLIGAAVLIGAAAVEWIR